MALMVEEAVDLLRHRTSTKRRQGAKRLRALADPACAGAVRLALEREVQDPRTWETQYQMIMALGVTGTRDDVPLLRRLVGEKRDTSMVNTALGDAIVRLDRDHEEDVTPVLWCWDQSVDGLADGALRAVAMLRLHFSPEALDALLDRVEGEPEASHLRFWPAVAAAGWTGPRVEAFLRACAASSRDDIAAAATQSLEGRYMKVNPL